MDKQDTNINNDKNKELKEDGLKNSKKKKKPKPKKLTME